MSDIIEMIMEPRIRLREQAAAKAGVRRIAVAGVRKWNGLPNSTEKKQGKRWVIFATNITDAQFKQIVRLIKKHNTDDDYWDDTKIAQNVDWGEDQDQHSVRE